MSIRSATGTLAVVLSLLAGSCSGEKRGVASRGEPCGKKTCSAGEYCCNRSCGICAPTGGFCTQQACE